METFTFTVHRNFAPDGNDAEAILRLHRERAALIHGLVDELGLQVQDWGNTDAERPRELVEVIIALGSAGVFSGLVAVAQSWIKRHKVREIELVGPKGTLRLSGATAEDAVTIARRIGFTLRD